MHRIDSSTATPDGRFTEGNPTIPIPATTVKAEWLNSVQEELVAVCEEAGIELDKNSDTQVLASILRLIQRNITAGIKRGNVSAYHRVTFGGSDGRRPIFWGETEPDEGYVLCDGGSNGAGGTVPDLRGRMILGASEARPAGSTGGSETHGHSLSGTAEATTLSVAQMPNHNHSLSRGNGTGDYRPYPVGGNTYQDVVYTNDTGGSWAHTHNISGQSGQAVNLSPFYTLAFVMRIA